MLTFFRTHWLVIAITLSYTLLATGGAYYFVASATHKHETVLLKMAEELKNAKGFVDKSALDTAKIKNELNKEKTLNTELSKTLTETEQQRESLRSSLEAMTVAANKNKNALAAKATSAPAIASRVCKEKNVAAEKNLKNQMQALQAFQADVYKREAALRERQKQLEETLQKLAEERRKIEQERAEYRWPHNGNQAKE